MVCYSFSGFDGYSHFEKNVFLLERFGRVYLLFRQQLGGKELVAEGTFFRNQVVILNPVRQPDRLAFPLEGTRCLRFYRFVTRRNRGNRDLGALREKVRYFGVRAGRTFRSAPGAVRLNDDIILRSLVHHRRFLSSNHPDL